MKINKNIRENVDFPNENYKIKTFHVKINSVHENQNFS